MTIDPGPGYRLLQVGEVIQEGDEYYWGETSEWEIEKHDDKSNIIGHTVDDSMSYRRPVSAPVADAVLDLDAIEKRANAATPGPWHVQKTDWHVVGGPGSNLPGDEHYNICQCGATWDNVPDVRPTADFIAHARTDIPALIEEVKRLRSLASANPDATDAAKLAEGFNKGAKHEREVWAGMILANPKIQKYWDELRGGEFSADDAASMVDDLFAHYNGQLEKSFDDVVKNNAALRAEAETLRAEVEKLKSDYNSEIDQFNAGYDAGKAGVPLDEAEQKWRMLHDIDHDVFAPGYAWGAWDRTQKELAALRSRLAELEAAADGALAHIEQNWNENDCFWCGKYAKLGEDHSPDCEGESLRAALGEKHG